MRLIDADALSVVTWRDTMSYPDEFDYGVQWAFEMMDEQPTVDAVPVIRCKECKHFRVYEIKDVTFSLCIRECMNAISMESDDYCSRAERKVKSSVYE